MIEDGKRPFSKLQEWASMLVSYRFLTLLKYRMSLRKSELYDMLLKDINKGGRHGCFI